MSRIILTVSILLLAQPSLAEEVRVTNGGVYGGLSYFTPLTNSGLRGFLYPDIGFSLDRKHHFADIGSAVPILLPDLIISAFRFLGGTDALPPLWDGLNAGEEQPGRMMMFRTHYRYGFYNSGPHKVDAGGLFDLWWMSPNVGGKYFGNIVWNLGASFGYGFGSDAISFNMAWELGNGFSGIGAFNPFVGWQAMARVRLGKWVGLYVRANLREQNFDYSGFESNDKNYPPELFDVREWELLFSADIGLVFAVGPSPRW